MLSNTEQKERKSRLIAVAGTLALHGLLIGGLVILSFRTPLPLPAEEGVDVYVDNTDIGQVPDITGMPPAPPDSMNSKPKDDNLTQVKSKIETPKKKKVKGKSRKVRPHRTSKRTKVIETPNEIIVNP